MNKGQSLSLKRKSVDPRIEDEKLQKETQKFEREWFEIEKADFSEDIE